MEIVEALKKLDPSDDSQWTSDGLPKLDTVRQLAEQPNLTRKEITLAAPEYTRVQRLSIGVDPVYDKPLEELADKPPEKLVFQDGDMIRQGIKDAEDEAATATLSDDPIDRKKEIDERINDLNQQKGVIECEVDALLREQTRLQTSQFVDNSAAADTKARLYYVAQQNRIRAEKAKRGRAFLESGANVADINPKSALDQAFSRNTKRGTARPPVRALKTE